MENNMEGFNCRLPFQIVVIQLNAFTAEGIAINKSCKGKYRTKERVHTRYEHVVTPNDRGKEGNTKDRCDHRTVSKNRFSGVGCQNL